MRRVCVWMVVLFLGGCGAAPDGRIRNNGHLGAISLEVPGIPAQGATLRGTLFIRGQKPGCTGDATACETRVWLAQADAACRNEAVCAVKQVEGAADGDDDTGLVLTVLANRAGTTELDVTAVTLDGEVVVDRFCMTVARPTQMTVACPSCQDGIPMGGQADAACALWNRAVSAEPLVGACAAFPQGPAVVVSPAPAVEGGQMPGPPGMRFTVTRTRLGLEHVVFSHGALSKTVAAW